ncbi:hypothetical protein WA158_005222 [Blastocystis sp. Blastoise]
MLSTLIKRSLPRFSLYTSKLLKCNTNIISNNIIFSKQTQLSSFVPQIQLVRCFSRYAPDPKSSLQYLYPEIAAQWHPIKNGNLLPIHVHPHSNKIVWWKCPKGIDHEWCSPVRLRISPEKKMVQCPFCRGRIPCADHSLANYPLIVKNWHPTKNKYRPEEVCEATKDPIWIQCVDHPDHVYCQPARLLVKSAKSIEASATPKPFCLVCRGYRVSPSSSLAATFPIIAKEWHPYKNKLTPDEISPKSNKKAWFICPNGHEYQAVIANRTTQGSNCPFCGKRYLIPSRSLATNFPSIAATWHPTKNGSLTPDQVFSHSSRRVWWLCENGHEWITSINNRTNNNGKGSNCPICCNRGRRPTKSFSIKDIVPSTVTSSSSSPSPSPSPMESNKDSINNLPPCPPSLPIDNLLDSIHNSPHSASSSTENVSSGKVKKSSTNTNKKLIKKQIQNQNHKNKSTLEAIIKKNVKPIEGSEHNIDF